MDCFRMKKQSSALAFQCGTLEAEQHSRECSATISITRVRDRETRTPMSQSAWEETVVKAKPASTEMTGDGCLLQIHPLDISGELIKLTADRTTIGRDEASGICIADESISRRHAMIERSGDHYQITDLGSTNGTCVNEIRIESASLTPGDRVQFGSRIFKFLATNHIELQYHEAIYSMMTRDGLTGTLNKRYFLDLIGREFQKSRHRGTALSLILFDIDHFKSINDTHGHLAGDQVLIEMGSRIGKVVAEHDVFARYGGEEFAILITSVPLDEASDVAERCRFAVEATPFATSVGPLDIRISLGVAEFAALANPQDPSQLVQAADEKLYEAKRNGRNRVCR
jgi:diguanylate cyclase (GGDEF)-like protein